MTLTRHLINLIVDQMLDIWETSDQWIKGTVARSEHDEDVDAASPYAIMWCAVGCKEKALYELGLKQYDDEFQAFMDHYAQQEAIVRRPWGGEPFPKYSSVVTLNDADDTTFEDVKLFVKCLKDKSMNWPTILDPIDQEEEEECDE